MCFLVPLEGINGKKHFSNGEEEHDSEEKTAILSVLRCSNSSMSEYTHGTSQNGVDWFLFFPLAVFSDGAGLDLPNMMIDLDTKVD